MLLEDFHSQVLAVLTPQITESMPQKSYWDYLINGSVATRSYSETEMYKFWLLSGFIEISETHLVLQDIAIMLSRLNSRKASLPRMRMLTYHIHNYFGENYVLENRLVNYPKLIFRKSKRWNKQTESKAEEIASSVRVAFKPVRKTRGAHIHGKRFIDYELARLSQLERAAVSSPADLRKPLLDLFKVEFGICRLKWFDLIKENNRRIQNFLEIYFDRIHGIVFTRDGTLIESSSGKGA